MELQCFLNIAVILLVKRIRSLHEALIHAVAIATLPSGIRARVVTRDVFGHGRVHNVDDLELLGVGV